MFNFTLSFPLSHVNGSDSKGELVVPVKTQQLLANLTLSSSDLQPPSMFHYLPHLVGKPEGLRPAFKISQGRMGGTFTFTLRQLSVPALVCSEVYPIPANTRR